MTGGKAQVIYFNDPEFVVLKYTGQGVLNEIAKCPGCKVVDKVQFTGTELGSALQQKAATALLQHPEANAVKSPYTAATILGIAPAVAQSGRVGQIYVMGGEGSQPELDLMRPHQGVNAAMIAPSDWVGSLLLTAGTGTALTGSQQLVAGSARALTGSQQLVAGSARTLTGSQQLVAGSAKALTGPDVQSGDHTGREIVLGAGAGLLVLAMGAAAAPERA